MTNTNETDPGWCIETQPVSMVFWIKPPQIFCPTYSPTDTVLSLHCTLSKKSGEITAQCTQYVVLNKSSLLLILNSPNRPGKGGTYNENNNWLGSPTVLLQRVIAWNNTSSQRGGSTVESQCSRPVFAGRCLFRRIPWRFMQAITTSQSS